MKSEKQMGAILFSLLFIHCGSSSEMPSGTPINPNMPISEKILCPGANAEKTDGYGGGDGTQSNPYLVCTNEQFKGIQGDMNQKRFFRLTTDLDFSSEGNIRIIAISPLAVIDGDNHKIKKITIEQGHGWKDNGIFGQLNKDMNGNRDEIRNLIIENVTVIGDGTEGRGGIIAAANWAGVISNVHVTRVVKIEYPGTIPSHWSAGGLVGHNASLIEDSSFDGQVSGVYHVGGIAGINEGTIRNCTASGTIQGRHGVGGLVGVQLKAGITESSKILTRISALSHFDDLIGTFCQGNVYSDCNM